MSFTILRGALTPLHVATIKQTIYGFPFDNSKRGTVKFEPGLVEFCISRLIDRAFTERLGPWKILADNKQSIIMTAGSYLRGTTWHQECDTIPHNAVICWVSLDDGAGSFRPGLSFLEGDFTGPVDELLRDHLEEAGVKENFIKENGYQVVTPILDAGDAVFISPFTPHKTYVRDDMIETRLALKLTAIPCEA